MVGLTHSEISQQSKLVEMQLKQKLKHLTKANHPKRVVVKRCLASKIDCSFKHLMER